MEYYAILRPAIAALNSNDPQTRAAVYQRARTIVANRALDSAVGNAEISGELLALENAIQRIEAEFVREAATPIEEWEPAPSIDLEERSGWIWKATAAVLIFGTVAIAGAIGYSFWTDYKVKPTQQTAEVFIPIKSVGVTPQDIIDSDQRPFTQRRQLVYYRTNYPPGAVVISKSQRFLYLIRPNLSALRYSIALGRKCIDSVGLFSVSEKQEFPGWNDPASSEPSSPLLAKTANPLGARALYLESDERLIHGISRVLGLGSSLACFQLVNDDVIDLFERVPVGTRVVAAN